MPRAVQTPFRESDAESVGKRTFRKQLLPIASVPHGGRTLEFTEDYLRTLQRNFAAGKRDQVPFVLVDGENRHTDDPEAYRGEVTGLEVAGDGAFVTLELSEEGAELVRKNPKLGISARIDDSDPDNPELLHVAGTLDPVVKGMKPWESVDLSDSDRATEVVDLTGESFSDPVPPDPKKLTDADREKLTELVGKDPAGAKDALTSGGLSDEDAKQIVDDLLADVEETTTTETRTPEPATLSEADRKKLDLAEQHATEARDEARRARQELAEERYRNKRAELAAAGVPPAILDAAEPVLRGDKQTIELSSGTTIDAGKAMEQILTECKGMIDLSVIGVGDGPENSEAAEAKRMAQEWADQQTGKRPKAEA